MRQILKPGDIFTTDNYGQRRYLFLVIRLNEVKNSVEVFPLFKSSILQRIIKYNNIDYFLRNYIKLKPH